MGWFVLFLCSRWGKSIAEIEELPYSELMAHKEFWDTYRWGMADDMSAIATTMYMRSKSSKSKTEPWMVKNWTVQRGFAYEAAQAILKPASAIRSGFFAIVDAIKGMSK